MSIDRTNQFESIVHFIRDTFNSNEFIPLHEPRFIGKEKQYLDECIDSTFVSSIGEFIELFEFKIQEYTGIKHAIAAVNGTAALHISLKLAGVEPETEVITQSLTFVATCNAIRYCSAKPVLIDVDKSTMGLSPNDLEIFLDQYCQMRDDGACWNKSSGRRVSACLPMHTYGFPVQSDTIKNICDRYNIEMIEDTAESLGSFYNENHTGMIGKTAALSFNGNKIITTGGGGMILTNDDDLAIKAKHITTTAKVPHPWDFVHNEVGYNYRLPNLNAALGVAQIEYLQETLERKRWVAKQYQEWGKNNGLMFMMEPIATRANYWLNVAIVEDENQKILMLEQTNNNNILTRPSWTPMHKLQINADCQTTNLENTEWFFDRIVNVPSSALKSK